MRLAENTVVDGRYRVVSRIGSGGMADVWRAQDTELDRTVALKILHERFAQDSEFVERFRREASAAAGLQHPNVVGVFDRGEYDGTYYIAMELVEGSSLKELIERGLSVGEAVEIVRQILVAARFAHEKGIVHRDLKPQNVLIDPEGRARVADFGIARAGASEITQTGSVMGTAQYLSPEQAQGLDVTPASDLYSIGVILYEALTRRVPFQADSAVAVALKQVSERPRPPSELNPAVPPALDAVVLRALAKDPANRFNSADGFLAALDAAELDPSGGALGDTAAYAAVAAPGQDTAVREPPAPPEEEELAEEAEDDRPWWKQPRWIAVAALLALLAVGAAWLLFFQPDQVRVPTVINKSQEEATVILEAAGFEVATTTTPTGEQPPGTVLEQDPPAASEADEGSTVTLSVASALGEAKIPPVEGLTERAAVKKLRKAGFLVESKQEFSDEVVAGRSIGTEPEAGTRVERESVVTLLISKGEDLVEVPFVVGDSQQIAEAELERAGFIVDVDTQESSAPEDEVTDQSPPGGEQLPRGERVTIVVSTGESTVVVPGVEGKRESAARGILVSRGLGVSVRRISTDVESEDGRVVNQSPSAGSRVAPGSQVTMFVGDFEG